MVDYRKKVGIYTIYSNESYGAMLQAFSLVYTINKMGNDVNVISTNNNEKLMPIPHSANDFFKILRVLKNYKKMKSRFNLFESFKKEYLKVIDSNYYEKCDLLITGSDQTLNLDLYAFKDVFLQEHNTKITKATYASSFGEKLNVIKNNPAKKERIIKALNDFDFLSVREKDSCEYLNKNLNKHVELVLDPTMLLTKEDLSIFNLKKLIDEEYILYFAVLNSREFVDELSAYAKKHNLKIVAVHLQNRFEMKSKFDYYIDAGPIEFLSLIKYAKFIITTSFHGTVYSLMFEKNFYAYDFEGASRIKTLLSYVDLNDRCGTDLDCISQLKEINYKNVNKLLGIRRKDSIEYLEKVLEGKANYE